MATKKLKKEPPLPKINKPLIKSLNQFPVVGIGASAGGLDAFKKLLKAIPEDSGMAYVLVQHLDPKHESLLPELLQKVTKIPVLEITDDIKVHPDHIYVIPSNKMMVATDGVLLLADRPPKSTTERNLPIDLFFKSLAEVHQEHAIGVVLSGTASDGTRGLKAIKENGGITFAQDEASAEYESMPHNAILAGVVDFIMPPGDIPKKLLEVTQKTYRSDEELQNIPKQDEDVFKQILSLLRIRKGVDFTYYKQTTIRRRILRRMVVNKNEETEEYLKFLRGNNQEQDLLYQDMLIPVTSFFRDKKVFENLCNHVFPSILENKIPGEITRIWVAGCSTGQEAYSFAICFKEFLGDNHERIQIFGTDLSETSITKARLGLYEKSEVDAVAPERLKDFFTKSNGGYQVNKNIRDMCVFAHHNFLKDPPFGKMDCISCRNVLIYMEPYLQKKALTTFHYALNPKGFLLLGKSETTGGVPELFAAVEKNDKLYTRKDVPGRFIQVASQRSEKILNNLPENSKSEPLRTDFQKTADEILLSRYTPAGVVVNETMDIVHFRGNTSNYLEQAPGKPSHNLLMMAKSGLGFELRNILHKAKTDKMPVVKENIPININGSIRNISLEAVVLPNTLEPYYLILFHDNNIYDTDVSTTGPGGISNRKKVTAKTKKDDKELKIKLLEQELAQAREDMRSITEDQEASNEELQSANEELLSGSEELQSLNEELETSKEELQSTNEELTVLNHELVGLNEQVTDARNYAESIVGTLFQPLLVLDKQLRVKSANKAFYKTFQVNELETEGVLIYDLGNKQWNIPQLRVLLEEILPQKKQMTDFEVSHNFLTIGHRVILLNAIEITRERKEEKLILLFIHDITESKENEKILIANTVRFRQLMKDLPAAVYSCDLEGAITFYNEAAVRLWGRHPIPGKDVWDCSKKIYQPDGTVILFENSPMALAIKEGAHRLNAEIIMERGDGSRVNVLTNTQPELGISGKIIGAVNILFDITERVLSRKKIEASESKFRTLIEDAPVATCFFTGREMKVEIANEKMLSYWGKGNEVIGKPLAEAVPELIGQPFLQLLDEVYTTGNIHEAKNQMALLKVNGVMGTYYFDYTYKPIRNAAGEVYGILDMAVDVTDQVISRTKIEESEAFNRSILENSPDCVKLVDVNGRIQYMNSNGLCIMEIDDFKNIKNIPWIELWGMDERPVVLNALDSALQGKTVQFQAFGPTLKGTGKWWDVMVSPIVQPGTKIVSNIISVSRDITSQKEIQSQLEYRKALLEAHNEASIDGILLVDTKGKILSYNHKFIEIWNMPKDIVDANDDDAALGFAMNQLVHPEQFIEKVKWLYEHSAEICSDELEFKDGKIVERHGYPVLTEDGSYYAWSWTFRDITDKKLYEDKIRQSESHFRLMADLMPAKISNAKPDGEVTYFNQRWLDYTGMSFEELKDFGYHKIIHPDDLDEFQHRFQKAAETGTTLEMEMRFINKEGEYNWHLNLASPVKDENGTIKMWVGATTEIQKIKEEEQLKGDFLKMVSHELKTPVTSIKGYVQLLLLMLKEQTATPSSFLESPLQRIDSQVKRLTRLIEEMLDLSRIESGKLELRKDLFSLNELVTETVQDIRFTNSSHTINVSLEDTGITSGDRDRIEQVIINLVNNAIKYSPDNNLVNVRVYIVEDNQIAVSIQDFGIGIDTEHQKKIFNRFYRAGGKSEEFFAGFGIGLFIAKEIIERHNGSISIISEKTKGSTFTFILPLVTKKIK